MITPAVESMQRIRIALVAAACACGVFPTGAAWQVDRRAQPRIDETLRREGEALARLVEDAETGRAVPGEFVLTWSNDFFKARPGTFVPFTISLIAPAPGFHSALLYVRVVSAGAKRGVGQPAYETIFPVTVQAGPGEAVHLTRGFAVPPGRYRVAAALRESGNTPSDRGPDRPRHAGVLLQDLEVPDFWTGELAVSTIMLADRVEPLGAPVRVDELDEDPYAVGSNRIHVSRTRAFGRNRELIVAFLIYNLSVGPDRQFDAQVDYHLYKKDPDKKDPGPGGQASPVNPATDRPARTGERYVTRTNPQRFNPSLMGAQFDPVSGTPVLAGQAILLAGFEPGEYRLGITVTDLLSRKTLARDVAFSVTGS